MTLRRKFNGAKSYTEAWDTGCSSCFQALEGEWKLDDRAEARELNSPQAKEETEDVKNILCGRRASCKGRSQSGSAGGLYTSENAGMSSEKYVRIILAESLRILEEGSSAPS